MICDFIFKNFELYWVNNSFSEYLITNLLQQLKCKTLL